MVNVLVPIAVLAAFGALHWYAWRRLVRETTSRGSALRRAGSVAFVAAPLLTVGTLAAGRAGAPFPLQQIMAWPGYLWLALFLYLLLALLAGEIVRPLLRRRLARRDTGMDHGTRQDAEATAAHRGEPGAEQDKELVLAGKLWPVTAQRDESGGALDTAEHVAVPAPAPAPEPEQSPATAPAGPSRRLFVSRVVGGAAAALAVGTVAHGTYGVLRGPQVKRVTVPLAKLPRSAHGFRIAVVSDVHLGPILGRGFSQRVVDTINATQPDLIAVVGDLVDGSVEDLGPAAQPLAQLRARHGAYFVTGNHEYVSGAEQWIHKVRDLGLRPLENARTELPGFDLAGVNDVRGEDEGQGPDFVQALGDRDRSRAAVLLAHQPVVIHDAVRHGVDLQLSGHTHGGQLWPTNFIAELANPTVAGLERYGDTQLYVSRGAGAWGPPVRVGAPSDITVVQLASRQA
ncbi:metallophosphoesterase [Streptomyces himalayensis]|uniref:Metallophosphoesterase n=1 Tax=Streptomyces himalayensis subsp. himalayensis TaxID=2756131 RepID=A0A7W0DL00_9ACTN|nr:metallophosphoesterase [Streptomyces himalayensis]MBA2946996.1 metallophosphoesterase [Streptomyces himalayensis subsp. himalayensis]